MKIVRSKQSYSFIFSLIDIKCDLPIEVIPDHQINKANDEQVDEIRTVLESFLDYTNTGRHHYEGEWIPKTDGHGNTFNDLPRSGV